MSDINPTTIEAYNRAYYRLGLTPDAPEISIGSHSPLLAGHLDETGSHSAIFITACNPLGEVVSDAENQTSHERLRDRLAGLATRLIEGEGGDKAGVWPSERSFLALGIGEELARTIGRDFRQDAIVFIGSDAIPRLMLLR